MHYYLRLITMTKLILGKYILVEMIAERAIMKMSVLQTNFLFCSWRDIHFNNRACFADVKSVYVAKFVYYGRVIASILHASRDFRRERATMRWRETWTSRWDIARCISRVSRMIYIFRNLYIHPLSYAKNYSRSRSALRYSPSSCCRFVPQSSFNFRPRY